MTYVCPICQNSIQSISERCSGCGRIFDPALWPEEAYSLKGMHPNLKFFFGNGDDEYVPRTNDFLIGHSIEGNGLQLEGVGVSRVHARVYCKEGEWHIEKKGTQELIVNDVSVEEQILTPDAEICIGSYLLYVSISYEQNRPINTPSGILCSEDNIPLDKDRIKIGSDAKQCRVLITGADPCHAMIYKRTFDDSWYLVDCASRSGVKINGERIRNKKLFSGDEISVAGLDFIFHGDHLSLGQTIDTGLYLTFEKAGVVVPTKKEPVLQNLSFSISPGEFIGILGPSGCGKSSLIQRIAGLANFTEGKMFINGVHYNSLPDSYLNAIAYQPQQNTLHESLTLRKELSCYRTMHAQHGHVITKEDAQKALQLVGLEQELDKPISTLSGGQQRRAGIALALLREPQMLILDEPTSGLDPATETEIMEHLKRISKQNKTVLCSTHIMGNIQKFDKVLVLSQGYVVFWGTPSELFSYRPFDISEPHELYRIFASEDKYKQIKIAEHYSSEYYTKSMLARKYVQAPVQSILPDYKKPVFTKQVLGYWKRMFYESLSFTNGKWWKNFKSSIFLQMIWQPLLVALVLRLACANHIRESLDDQKEALFFAAVAVFWLGINNSVRELVKERVPWRCLERLERISLSAYLTSKISWSTALCVFQTALFMFFMSIFDFQRLIDEKPPKELIIQHLHLSPSIFIILALVCITGAWVGLAISSMNKSESSAVSWLPIIVIPVLFFSQPIIRNTNYSDSSFEKGLPTKRFKIVDRDGKYSKWAYVAEGFMPCNPPEILMDKVINNTEGIRKAWLETIRILGFYMVLSLTLTTIFQNIKEKDWKGR